MAAYGLFTYDDLYAGRAKEYNYKTIVIKSSPRIDSIRSEPSNIDGLFRKQENLLESILSNTVQPTTGTVQSVPFDSFSYIHWLLISFAIILILILNFIAIFYCYRYCRKTSKARREKKAQSSPNFYHYRGSNRTTPLYNIYQSTAPLFFSSPHNASRSKSPKSFDSQLLRQGLEAVGTPPAPRVRQSVEETAPSTFTGAASDLLTEIKGRISTRSSRTSLDTSDACETQKANVSFNDESKTNGD